MSLYQVSYWIHVVMLLIFLLLLGLPFVSKSLVKKGPEKAVSSLNFWSRVLMLSHIALVVSLITGFILRPGLGLWFWLIAVVFLAIGAFMGITNKSIRLALTAAKENKSYDQHLNKLFRFSSLLAVSLIVIVLLMGSRF